MATSDRVAAWQEQARGRRPLRGLVHPKAVGQGLLLVLCLLLLVTTGCTRPFFWPQREHAWDPARAGIEYRDVMFRSTDGVRLHSWFLPADDPSGTIVFLHGNAQNVSTHIAAVHWLPERGYNVFMPDYRGFGRSEGEPDFAGIHKDARAAIAHAREREDTDPGRIVVLGQSLGGSVAITTVARHGDSLGVRALVADSPFSSYRGIAREKLAGSWVTWPFQVPLSWAVPDGFAPVNYIADVAPIPTLLIAGETDTTVPSHHSERLRDAAGEPVELWLLPETDHTAAFARADVRDRLVSWLDARLVAE